MSGNPESLTLCDSQDPIHQPEKSPNDTEPKTKNTYIFYSVGNLTLFLDSLDPTKTCQQDRDLLDSHLTNVKVTEPDAPIWPNPSIITLGMANAKNGKKKRIPGRGKKSSKGKPRKPTATKFLCHYCSGGINYSRTKMCRHRIKKLTKRGDVLHHSD